ncbi:Bestrophin [Dictyocaulus viviparus]|uniref:Bestrophin homolog n=1 Tax=Dictyocaulus viviparus TaxID=29172 RepID=A0A0D8XQS0_DICVI|nr:Bestrophin [Dictyocaulus viviparus]
MEVILTDFVIYDGYTGSIWKSVWAELTVWLILYGSLSILYSPCLWIAQYVRGSNERARLIRRTLIRYLVLTQAIVFRDVSSAVKKRFPTMNHLVTSGLMTEKELEEFDSIVTNSPKYWVPMNWVFSLVRVAREEGRIPGEMIYVDLMEKIRQYRVQVLSLTLYDWVPVPLVYTQVVHLAVRSYFAVGLMGRQYLRADPTRTLANNANETIDLYVPIMTILQFVFFVGWMKVAEVLLNPLGEDDDDFECNWILDRNLQVGFNVVDTTYDRFPVMVRDQFWEDSMAEPLYTIESAQRPINPQVGSCADMNTEDDAVMMRPRRRTISHSSHWEGEFENNEVIPVYGLDKMKENSSSVSCDSTGFSGSFLNQSRRISQMFKRMQGRRKSRSHPRGVVDCATLSANSGLANASFVRPWRSQRVSDINVEAINNGGHDSKSTYSSCSSLDRFGESFHNNVSPPNVLPITSNSKSIPDMKASNEERGSKTPNAATSPKPAVAWFVDELSVIEEEDPEKRRLHEEGSIKGSTSSGSRIGEQTDSPSGGSLPTVQETEEPKNESEEKKNI